MSNEKENRKKGSESLIRVMCFLLGVLLTVSAVLIKDRFFAGLKKAVIEPETREANEPEKVAEVQEEPVKEEPEKKETLEEISETYTAEAEVMYQELVASVENNETEPVQTEDDGTYIIDGKPSKINWNTSYPLLSEEYDQEWHAARETSFDTTMKFNELDKKVIANNTVDFSDVKIAIIGDSITAATNLSEENQAKYNYPKLLEEILGCEVVNLGIGGSVVSRCVPNFPMVDRWGEIPEDVDVIIIFGGTNDCLFMNKWNFGEVEYEHRMTSGTFCGDLDEMCSGIKYCFTEHNDDRYVKLFYINPMSTILNDAVYSIDPGNMVQQSTFAAAINEIVPPYGFDVIDLYNSNYMNSHDEEVNHFLVNDGVHPNEDGYRLLAEHIASQILQRVNKPAE